MMTSTLPLRTAAMTVLAVAAFSGAALSGTAAASPPTPKSHTSLSIRTIRGAINPGGGDIVKGQLQSFDGHNAGRRVVLLARPAGTPGWTKAKRHRTRAHGQVAFQVTPATTTLYQLAFYGNKKQQASRSGVVRVRVLDTTSLVISVGSGSIDPGESDSVNGVLSLDGTPLVGDTVKLFGATRHQKLSYMASAITGNDGSVSFAVTPVVTSHYVLVFKKTDTNAGARSAVTTIHVRQPSSLSIRARHARQSGMELISGDLRGGGRGLGHRKVTLQDRPSGTSTWTTVGSKLTHRNGGIGFVVPNANVSEDYQLVFAGGPLYDGCQSGVVTVTVA
jgi:hypothetical protein